MKGFPVCRRAVKTSLTGFTEAKALLGDGAEDVLPPSSGFSPKWLWRQGSQRRELPGRVSWEGPGEVCPGEEGARRGWAANAPHSAGDWRLLLGFGNSRKQRLLCPGSPRSSLGSTRSTDSTTYSCFSAYNLL